MLTPQMASTVAPQASGCNVFQLVGPAILAVFEVLRSALQELGFFGGNSEFCAELRLIAFPHRKFTIETAAILTLERLGTEFLKSLVVHGNSLG